MKRFFLFVAVLALAALSVAAQGNAAPPPNFSGTWTLDVTKSQLGERNNIESQTLTVKQTATDIKVDTATKRTAPPTMPNSSAPPAGKPGFGGGSSGSAIGGRIGGGDTPWTYSLEGKESKGEMSGPMGAIPVSLNAKFNDQSLDLSRSFTMTTPRGEMTNSTKETWQLSKDGKTLTINSERTTMRGTESTVRVYTKKDQK
jgi:hypothetical protein